MLQEYDNKIWTQKRDTRANKQQHVCQRQNVGQQRDGKSKNRQVDTCHRGTCFPEHILGARVVTIADSDEFSSEN